MSLHISEADPSKHGSDVSLAGRVVIITGGGQGLGRAFAKTFAALGAVPVIAELNAAKGEAVADEVQSAGGKALAIRTDVAEWNSVRASVGQVIDQFGRVDVLINNAAIFSTIKMRPFDQIPAEEWDDVLRVNVTGVFNCCRAVAAPMRSAGWGRIINISSGAVVLGRPDYLHYTTSKAALIGMTRSMARELGPAGVTVNAILPGATFTEIERETITSDQKRAIVARQCIPRPEVPTDLTGVAAFLASDEARFITGQSILVDGGATFL